jgi:hypothetical protein
LQVARKIAKMDLESALTQPDIALFQPKSESYLKRSNITTATAMNPNTLAVPTTTDFDTTFERT